MKLYTLAFKATHSGIPYKEKIDGWVLWGWACNNPLQYRGLLYKNKEDLERYCSSSYAWSEMEYVILELGDVIYEAAE